MSKTIHSIDIFRYYRIDVSAAETLRRFVSQILETYMDEGDVPIILSLTKTEFENLAQAYNDLLIGYRHPRINSMQWNFRIRDRTLTKLAAVFPCWQTVESIYQSKKTSI